MKGILWVLKTGAPWVDLPQRCPSSSTCWRRLVIWEEKGIWLNVWQTFLGLLDEKHLLDWKEFFIDGSFSPAKKGKGTKWMVATDGKGIPVALHFESASRAEIKLLEPTLAKVRVPQKGPGRPKNKPVRVIADRGYDSAPHRRRLQARGIDLIVPYRSSSKKRTFEDGRKLRRYRKRYKVERSISWFGNYRRLLNRFEHKLLAFSAFFHVACIMIVSRWF